jgi:transposase
MKANQVQVTNEPVHDVPLLLGVMEEMGIRRHIDGAIEQHGGWEGVSVGTIIEIWLCYLLTEHDHRLEAVREWVNDRQQVFNALLGIRLRETELSDDRLAVVLGKLGDEGIQAVVDEAMVREWVTVYALPSEVVRLDSTSVSVYSEIEDEDSLIQHGHSKDHRPDLGQFKLMLSTLDPLGMPLHCRVLSGEQADDGLYVPSYDETVRVLGRSDVLVVGDSKMAALATRAHLVGGGSRYLCAYRPVGNSSAATDWANEALAHEADWERVNEVDEKTGELRLVAYLYTGQRDQTWTTPDTQQTTSWSERVLVVRAESMREKLVEHSHERWHGLEQALLALRRPIAKGRRRYRTQADLQTTVAALLARYDLSGLVTVTLVEETLANGTSRWIVGDFSLDKTAWQTYQQQLGWQLYLTNATTAQYENTALLWNYRHQIFHERSFSRLKTRNLNIRPVFLRDELRIVGLTWLLCLALRLLTLTEFRVRTQLALHHQALIGLNPAVPSRAVTRPTTERILHAFHNLTFTAIDFGHSIQHFIPDLSAIQCQLLALLNLPSDLYSRLASLSPLPLTVAFHRPLVPPNSTPVVL